MSSFIRRSSGGGGGTVSWTPVTADTVLEANKKYLITAPSGTIVLTLPASSVVNDSIEIASAGAANFQVIVNNGGQTIHNASATNYHIIDGTPYASIKLNTIAANTTWAVSFAFGSFLFKNFPTFVASAQNSLPAIRFDGVDDFLQCLGNPSLSIPSDLWIFCVFKVSYDNSNHVNPIIDKQFGTTDVSFYDPAECVWGLYNRIVDISEGESVFPGNSIDTFTDNSFLIDGDADVSIGSYKLIMAHTPSDNTRPKINGVDVVVNCGENNGYPDQVPNGAFLDADGPITLASTTSGNFLNGEIAEIIVFKDGMDPGDAQAIFDHLNQKYGFGAGTPMSNAAIAALNPNLFLRADSLTLADGDAVLAWNDQSANGNDFTV